MIKTLLEEFEACRTDRRLANFATAFSCRFFGIYIDFPALWSFLLHLAAKHDAPESGGGGQMCLTQSADMSSVPQRKITQKLRRLRRAQAQLFTFSPVCPQRHDIGRQSGSPSQEQVSLQGEQGESAAQSS